MHNPDPHEIKSQNKFEEDLRRQAEGERRGEAKIRSFLDAASHAVVGVESDGKIVLVNRRTEEMFGYWKQELLGQNLERLLPARYRHAHGRRKDGTEFPVEVGLGYVD